MAQMLTAAHGHQDQSRRRARVPNVRTPLGTRDLGSVAAALRQPRGVERARHARGRLFGRGRFRRWPIRVVMVSYDSRSLEWMLIGDPRRSN